MLDQMRSGADTHAAEDDFEWVNDWAAASARPDQTSLPEPMTRVERAAAAPSEVSAVAILDASPLAEPATPDNAPVADNIVSVVPLTQAEEVDSAAVAPPASAEREQEAVPIVAPRPLSADAIVTVDPIPQSPAEVEPLPLADTDPAPVERRPWTSLFRLISGPGSAAARAETVSVMATEPVAADAEPVAAEAPAAVDLAAVPLVQADTAEIPLAPDQLARDIAEIEQVRDQLLSLPEPDLVPKVAAPRSRTSDLVPVLVGAALGFILLVVFGAAASFVSLR